MTETAGPTNRRRPVREFFAHLVKMPRWHKTVLMLATVLAIAGLVGQVSTKFSPATTTLPKSSPGPAGASHAFTPSDSPQDSSRTPISPTLAQRLSPSMMHIGLGLLGGFIVGWAFRAFIKMMALITLAGVVILTLLSYFNVLNVDLTAAENQFRSSTSWVSDQASRLKDVALAHIPGSASTFAGMFLGFRRK